MIFIQEVFSLGLFSSSTPKSCSGRLIRDKDNPWEELVVLDTLGLLF